MRATFKVVLLLVLLGAIITSIIYTSSSNVDPEQHYTRPTQVQNELNKYAGVEIKKFLNGNYLILVNIAHSNSLEMDTIYQIIGEARKDTSIHCYFLFEVNYNK